MNQEVVMFLVLARYAAEGRDIAFVTDEEMNAAIESAIDDLLLAGMLSVTPNATVNR